jgi:hypothetical protein
MGVRGFLALVAAVALASCSLPAMNQEVDALAKGFYESVRTGADLNNDARLSPEIRNGNVNASLAGARTIIPNMAATRIDNRNQNYRTNNGLSTAVLVHVYHYPDRTIVAETVLTKPPGAPAWLIAGFHVNREGPGATNSAAPPPEPVLESSPADAQPAQ